MNQEGNLDLLKLLRWTLLNINVHFRTLYEHGVWIPAAAAIKAVEAGLNMGVTWQMVSGVDLHLIISIASGLFTCLALWDIYTYGGSLLFKDC